ncbi:hypothetical protein BO79DRAFT_276611, partial [Aspergillus costaricaensis CBS 115574]
RGVLEDTKDGTSQREGHLLGWLPPNRNQDPPCSDNWQLPSGSSSIRCVSSPSTEKKSCRSSPSTRTPNTASGPPDPVGSAVGRDPDNGLPGSGLPLKARPALPV